MASYTENLNLLKKNPLTDGSDTFNIETMLNENWDKIDAFAGVAANPAELWVWEKRNASTLAHIGYVAAPSSTAYPTDGTSGGYRYTRLGQIGGAARIETGSYVGTGTYGSSNPNSLTFGFAPKLFSIYGTRYIGIPGHNEISSTCTNSIRNNILPFDVLSTSYGQRLSPNVYLDNARDISYAKKSEDGKTISWYADSADHQNNMSDFSYFYFAIG